MRLTPLLMILICTPYWAASPARQTQQTKASLELTTRIARSTYCKSSDPAGRNTLRLDLRLSYKNVGQQRIILYKGSSIVNRLMVSATVQDAANKRYLLDMLLMVILSDPPEIADSSRPDKNFVILGPSEAFGTDTQVAFPLTRNSDDKTATDSLAGGHYALQVHAWTWLHSNSLKGELRQRWNA